jgi:hypothetical protein
MEDLKTFCALCSEQLILVSKKKKRKVKGKSVPVPGRGGL